MTDHFEWAAGSEKGQWSENPTGFVAFATHTLFAVTDVTTTHSHGNASVINLTLSALQALFNYANDREDHHARLLNDGLACVHECVAQVNRAFGRPHVFVQVAALSVKPPYVHYAQVGACRVFRMRGGSIAQLTQDDTLVNAARQGTIATPPGQLAELESGPFNDALVQVLGGDKPPFIQVRSEECLPGDLYLLATRGLSRTLDPREILSVISRHSDVTLAVSELVETAAASKGRPCAACVLVRIK